MTIFIGALIVWKALSEATFQRGAFFEIPFAYLDLTCHENHSMQLDENHLREKDIDSLVCLINFFLSTTFGTNPGGRTVCQYQWIRRS